MKKKLGVILLVATLFGTVVASSASASPNCYRVSDFLWICEY